jgi:hypothetical protein
LLQLLAVCGLLFYGFSNILKDHRGRSNLQINVAMPLTIVLFSLTYILALILSISFIDAHTPIDGRTLSPVYVCGAIFVVSTAWNSKPLRRKRLLWRSFHAMLSVVISVNFVMVIFSAIQMHNEGLGFTNRTWRNSQTIAYVSSLPSEARIYSNGPDAILYLNSREVQSIPRKASTISLASNPHFENEVVEMRNDLMQNGALIIYFDNITWRWYLPNKAELEDDYGFQALLQLQDGTIYGLSDFDLSTEEGGT